MNISPHAGAAAGLALITVVLLGGRLLPGGGGHDLPEQALTIPMTAADDELVGRGRVQRPLVPGMAEDRPYNPFTLAEETHRQQLRALAVPPPPPLALPDPFALPLPVR